VGPAKGRGYCVVIFTMTPFAIDMNYGRACNEFMGLLPDDGWGCIIDHDAMFTTRAWFRQIEEAIDFRPDAGAFTAVSNRIARRWQQAGNKDSHDIVQHRRFGAARLKTRTLLDITNTHGFGGVVIVISKKAWRQVGGFVDGMLCVDHRMHFALREAGRRVWLIEGLFVYHWRRAQGDGPPANAPRAAGCPCRGTESMPTVRVALP